MLKGHRTIITDGRTVYLNPTGNPGMATGGSGDVLMGILTGFLAQKAAHPARGREKQSVLEAAAAAVYLHGLAGDIAARRKTEPALLAMDIAEALPEAYARVLKPE